MADLQDEAIHVIGAVIGQLNNEEVQRIAEAAIQSLCNILDILDEDITEDEDTAEFLLILEELLDEVRQFFNLSNDDWDEMSIHSHNSKESGYEGSSPDMGSILSEELGQQLESENNEAAEIEPQAHGSHAVLPSTVIPIEITGWLDRGIDAEPTRKRKFADCVNGNEGDNGKCHCRRYTRRCDCNAGDGTRFSNSDFCIFSVSKKNKIDIGVCNLRGSASDSDINIINRFDCKINEYHY